MSDERELLAIIGEQEVENRKLREANRELNDRFQQLQDFVMNAAKAGVPLTFVPDMPSLDLEHETPAEPRELPVPLSSREMANEWGEIDAQGTQKPVLAMAGERDEVSND